MLIAVWLLSLCQGPEIQVQERFKVQYVLLDIVALDRRGQAVTDLTLSDFEVKEEGKTIVPTYFEPIDYRPDRQEFGVTEATLAGATPPPGSSKRQFVVVVDLAATRPREQRQFFEQFDAWLNQLATFPDASVRLHSMTYGAMTNGFVETLPELVAAAAKLADRYQSANDSSKLRVRRSAGRDMVLLDGPNSLMDFEKALLRCQQKYRSSRANQLNECVAQVTTSYVEELELRTASMLDRLALLTYDFEKHDGLKIMVLISPGFAVSSISSVYQLAAGYQQAIPGQPRFIDRPLHYERDFKKVIHGCIKNRIIFHTVDIFNKDLGFKRVISGRFNEQGHSRMRIYRSFGKDIAEGLSRVARESGGTFSQVDRLGPTITHLLDQNLFFYALGYDSRSGKVGDYRRIKINVKRRGVKLRYRRGYFGS